MADIKYIHGNPIVVGTSGIEDGAVTTDKLGNEAVTTNKIAGNSITDDKLAQSGGVLEKVDNLKSDLSSYAGIENVSITAQNIKRFITSSGTIISASGNYHVSDPIAVSKGDEIRFTCTVYGANITVVSLCDDSLGNIVPVVVGVSGEIESEYTYRVNADGYIALSYRYDKPYTLHILGDNSNVVIKADVDNNKIILAEQCGVTKISYSYDNAKKFITTNGVIDTASGTYHITLPIAVLKGDRVEFVATGAVGSAMISTCNSNSSNISPKVLANSDGLEHIYTYDVDKDGYIILSYNYTERADLYILSDYANKRLKADIDGIVAENFNLLNHKTLIDNKSISAAGVISDNAQYAITQPIPVKAGIAYSYNKITRIVFFNKSGNRISAVSPYADPGTTVSPATASYMIAMVMKFNSQVGRVYDTTDWIIVEGDTVPDYKQQQIVVNGYRIADTVASTHDNITAFRRWDKICYDRMPVVFASTESDATTEEDRMTSAIIAKYDALMSDNPLYISKTALGTASDGTTTIYRYDFKTPGAKVTSGSIPISTNEKTKIILISGVHPEFGGIYGLYNAMREITNNPDLANIKNGVHFVVIPTVNPYAIDTKNRKNANGVDIARNFEIDYEAGTDPTSSTYAGTEPLSEPESQIVNTVLSENRDAIMFASCHSFQLSSENNAIWGSCASMYTTNVTAKVVEKLSYAWRTKYTSIIPQTIDTIFGSAGISTESGSEGKQATKYGIQGLTLESSDYFPYDSQTPHTSFAISRASEVYLNFIATTLGLWESSDPKDLMMIGLH